jgi:antitoxin VapB
MRLSMLPLSRETEALIATKADRSGKSQEDVVREGLMHVAEALPWNNSGPRPKVGSKQEFIAALDEIAARCAARPVVDPRSDDELIGYDDFGLPR